MSRLSMTIFFVPASYFALMSKSKADCVSVMTSVSLRTTAQATWFL